MTAPPGSAYRVFADTSANGDTAHVVGTDKYPETWFVLPTGEVLRRALGEEDWNDPKLRAFAAEFSRAAGAAKS